MAGNKSWLDELHPASFRDVTFFVKDRGLMNKFGRRVARHEFPLREGPPNVDDLGPVGEKFTIEAFHVGDDIKSWRDDMRTAINTQGPGKLIHPRYGEMVVQAGDARWKVRGNTEWIVVTFYQTIDESETEQETDTTVALEESAEASLTGAKEAALGILDGDFGLDSIKGTIITAKDKLSEINSFVDATLQPLQDIQAGIDSIGSELKELIKSPLKLVNSIAGVVTSVLGLGNDIKHALDGYHSLGAAFGRVDKPSVSGTSSANNLVSGTNFPIVTNWDYQEPITPTTPGRMHDAQLNGAARNLVRTAGIVAAVKTIVNASTAISVATASTTTATATFSQQESRSPFDSADHAMSVRDEILAEIDNVALTAAPALYAPLMTMQAALVAHIESHGELPRVEHVEFCSTLPSLVIAHQLYGDITNEADIINRNRLRNPLFVDAGTKLEALNG
jgi:prophage DNA circulation protein